MSDNIRICVWYPGYGFHDDIVIVGLGQTKLT